MEPQQALNVVVRVLQQQPSLNIGLNDYPVLTQAIQTLQELVNPTVAPAAPEADDPSTKAE